MVYGGEKVRFGKLVNLFERFENGKPTAKNRSQKANWHFTELQGFYDQFKAEENSTNLYPVVRLVCPNLDKQGRIFNVAAAALAKKLVEGMGIPGNSEDAQRLLKFQTKAGVGQGNLSNILFDVLSKAAGRCCAKGQGNMTIRDVNDFLDDLAKRKLSAKTGDPKQQDQSALFKENMMKYTATEWKWICRIILREMKIGVSEKLTLTALHPDAIEYYACNNNDMVLLCEELTNRSVRKSVYIKLGTPFVPMMCEKPSEIPQSLEKAGFGNKEFYIEKKMDGERIQIHKDGDNISMFTRSSNNYTDLYQWSIKQILDKKLIKAEKAIIDAEILGWFPGIRDKEDPSKYSDPPRFLSPTTLKTIAIRGLGGSLKGSKEGAKGESFVGESVEGVPDEGPKCTLCITVFDILQNEDNSLCDKPLHERLEILEKVCVWEPDVFQRVQRITGRCIDDAYQAILDMGVDDEGVVLKDKKSTYKVGARTCGWMKLKPDYFCGGTDTMDVVIIGGEVGKGARSGKITQYIVGVADNLKPGETEPKIFRSFCKVGTGLVKKVHFELADYLQSIAVEYKRSGRSESGEDDVVFHTLTDWGIRCDFSDGVQTYFSPSAANRDMKYVFDPRKSKILEIFGDRRMIPSNVYMAGVSYPGCRVPIPKGQMQGMGWSIRFPRVGPKGLRDDLSLSVSHEP